MQNLSLRLSSILLISAMSCLFDSAELTSAERNRFVSDSPVIELRPEAVVRSRVIRLGDIAEVTGGSESLRKRIAELDVDDASPTGKEIEVSASQIEIRLRLEGIDLNRVVIRGSKCIVLPTAKSPVRQANVVVGKSKKVKLSAVQRTALTKSRSAESLDTPSANSLEQLVFDTAKRCVQEHLPGVEEDIEFRLAQPLNRDLSSFGIAADCRCSAELRSTGSLTGRVLVQVSVWRTGNENESLEVPVILDVRRFDRVVVLSKNVSRGKSMTESDLFVDRRDVTTLTNYCSEPAELIGHKLRRNIGALQIVTVGDLESAVNVTKAVIVKRQSIVKLVGVVGPVRVETVGEAQQDGRLGDIVRVKNVDSQVVVYGKVTGDNEVEVNP